MKVLKELLTVMAILGLAAAVASGEDANTVREDGTLRDAGSNVRPADRPNNDGTVRPPDIPKVVLKHAPDALKKMIDRQQYSRKAYHDRQTDFLREVKGATGEAKDTIRDQLKDNRETFLNRTQNLPASSQARSRTAGQIDGP